MSGGRPVTGGCSPPLLKVIVLDGTGVKLHCAVIVMGTLLTRLRSEGVSERSLQLLENGVRTADAGIIFCGKRPIKYGVFV
jgi:hypothetical protein